MDLIYKILKGFEMILWISRDFNRFYEF